MGKRVLVTGANRGIGLEFVRQYAGEGWDVVGTARDTAGAAELGGLAGEVLELDVGSADSVAAFAVALQDRTLDLVISNAGVYGPRTEQSFERMDYHAWLEVLRINTLGPMRVAQVVRGALMKGSAPQLVNITSKMGSIADTSGGQYAYRSSKAGLNSAMASLAKDWAPDGIGVTLFHPGWVQTDMGGPSALLSVEDSVHAMRRVIDGLELRQSGSFLNYDGSIIPW